jgi:hypothetical protein
MTDEEFNGPFRAGAWEFNWSGLPEEAFREIAEKAGVAADRYTEFRSGIMMVAGSVVFNHACNDLDLPNAAQQLTQAARAADELRQRISVLPLAAITLLAGPLDADPRRLSTWLGTGELLLGETAQAARTAAKLATGMAQHIQSHRAEYRKEPFRTLVFGLLSVTASVGGHLTFERKTQGGGLVDVLELIRDHWSKSSYKGPISDALPFAPQGLIPDPLPFSALEVIVALIRKSLKNRF